MKLSKSSRPIKDKVFVCIAEHKYDTHTSYQVEYTGKGEGGSSSYQIYDKALSRAVSLAKKLKVKTIHHIEDNKTPKNLFTQTEKSNNKSNNKSIMKKVTKFQSISQTSKLTKATIIGIYNDLLERSNKTSATTNEDETNELKQQIVDSVQVIEELDFKLDDTQGQIKFLTEENEELKAKIKELEANHNPNQVDLEEAIEEATEVVEEPKLNIKIVPYSERSFAIVGDDAKKFLDVIKTDLRGRFNKWLKDKDNNEFTGWICSVKYLDKAKETFNL
jgi:hypothetical protein